jgi:hypothetical protein
MAADVSLAYARGRLLTRYPKRCPSRSTASRHGGLAATGSARRFRGPAIKRAIRLAGETVEVRCAAGAVQILEGCEVVACLPHGTERRLVIDQRHYDGPSIGRLVLARGIDLRR